MGSTGAKAKKRPVTALPDGFPDNFQDPITTIVERFKASGLTYAQFARQEGLNHGLVRWLEERLAQDDLRWSDRLAGPDWQTAVLAFKPAVGVIYPSYLITPYPPRKCAVTDRWFVPSDPRQRFAPGLSEAVKRAARRDLARARRLYATRGDWGRKGQA